jgi:hypothetical protein
MATPDASNEASLASTAAMDTVVTCLKRGIVNRKEFFLVNARNGSVISTRH